MDKKTGIVIGVLVGIFLLLIGGTFIGRQSIDYTKFDAYGAEEASVATGGFEEMITGNPDAPIKLIEYGNYQCTACAPFNPYMNKLVEEYDGKVAVIFRSMSLPRHDNEKAAAAAALAASRQGYWKAYKDILFEKQDEWYELTGGVRQQQFEDYLKEVAGDKADLEKFREDMKSKEVSQKITFDNEMAKKAGAQWSPYVIFDGELVSQKKSETEVMKYDDYLDVLREKINKKLKEL